MTGRKLAALAAELGTTPGELLPRLHEDEVHVSGDAVQRLRVAAAAERELQRRAEADRQAEAERRAAAERRRRALLQAETEVGDHEARVHDLQWQVDNWPSRASMDPITGATIPREVLVAELRAERAALAAARQRLDELSSAGELIP